MGEMAFNIESGQLKMDNAILWQSSIIYLKNLVKIKKVQRLENQVVGLLAH
jgi:hypothetical protein